MTSDSDEISPFSPRSGTCLRWDALCLASGQSEILKGLNGSAKPGVLTCIMGPSGSGKSSLLHTLAGRISTSRQYQVTGDIYMNSKKVDPSTPSQRNQIAYTEQNDALLASATPREAIRFAARLRLDRSYSNESIEKMTERVLKELGLEDVADSLIGGTYLRGLSGGELRRVSLGVQLVLRPSILFLDEITSGLDSKNAGVVMDVCKSVARAGTAVLMVIHQPSSSIFAAMDNLYLLDKGRCMYNGRAAMVSDFFSRKGYPVPENYNPADWILQVPVDTNPTKLIESGFFDIDDKDVVTSSDEEVTTDGAEETPVSLPEESARSIRASLSTQLSELLGRDLKTLARDNSGLMMRFFFLAASSILTAISFTHVGSSSLDNSVQFGSHVGAIFFLLLGTTIVMQLVLFDFIEVRDLFIRELRANQYNVFSFGLTKVFIELVTTFLQSLLVSVIVYWSLDLQGRFAFFLMVLYSLTMVNSSLSFLLGAIPKDPRNAKELIALLILPQLLFSGFFVDPDTLPVWITWLMYLMPTTYAFRLVLSDEFSECFDFTDIERHTINCIESLSNALEHQEANNVTLEKLMGLYDTNTSYQVAQVGLFEGQENSAEYLAFAMDDLTPGTLFLDKCGVGEATILLNSAGEDNVCELTSISVEQGQINPTLIRDAYGSKPVVNFLQGGRFRYEPSTDLQRINVLESKVYFGPGVFDDLLGAEFDPVKMAKSVCQTLEEVCPESWEKDGFVDHEDCVGHMSALPITTRNDRGEAVIDGNSTGCRLVHAGLARKRDAHCPHISYLPEEDSDGKLKCHESNNFDARDLFDEADFLQFQLTSLGYALNGTSQVRSASTDPNFGSLSDMDTCGTTRIQDAAAKLSTVPANLFCSQYLESQDATGSQNTTYWIVLASMYIVIRSLGLYAIRTRARGQFLSQHLTK